MKVFAPAPFRYPAITGVDYPYGHQEIADDTLARTLIAAGLVQDESKGPDPMIVVSSSAPVNSDGRPDGTVYIQTA